MIALVYLSMERLRFITIRMVCGFKTSFVDCQRVELKLPFSRGKRRSTCSIQIPMIIERENRSKKNKNSL